MQAGSRPNVQRPDLVSLLLQRVVDEHVGAPCD